jgi:ATP-dependent protease ClpP protease subunit
MIRSCYALLAILFATVAEAQTQPSTSCEVRFIGTVDAYDLEPVVEQLQEASSSCAEVTLVIESGGGDVAAGWFFLHDLTELNLHTHVRGNAGSMAVPLFLAGDRRTMDNGATLFLHNILQVFAEGMLDAAELRDIATSLDADDQKYAAFVASRTSLSVEEVLALMEADTPLSAVDAVKFGFADSFAKH